MCRTIYNTGWHFFLKTLFLHYFPCFIDKNWLYFNLIFLKSTVLTLFNTWDAVLIPKNVLAGYRLDPIFPIQLAFTFLIDLIELAQLTCTYYRDYLTIIVFYGIFDTSLPPPYFRCQIFSVFLQYSSAHLFGIVCPIHSISLLHILVRNFLSFYPRFFPPYHLSHDLVEVVSQVDKLVFMYV